MKKKKKKQQQVSDKKKTRKMMKKKESFSFFLVFFFLGFLRNQLFSFFFFLLWTTPLLFIKCGELLLGNLLRLLPLLLLFSPRRVHFKWKRMATSGVVWCGVVGEGRSGARGWRDPAG